MGVDKKIYDEGLEDEYLRKPTSTIENMGKSECTK